MTVDLAVDIWAVVAVALFIVGLFFMGTQFRKGAHIEFPYDFVVLAIICAGWPVALVAGVVSLPFWAGYGLGKVGEVRADKRKRKRAEEKEALVRLRSSFDRTEPEWSILDEQIKSMA